MNIVLTLTLTLFFLFLLVLKKGKTIEFIALCHDTLRRAVNQSLRDNKMERKHFQTTFTMANDTFGTQTVFFTRRVLSPSDCQIIIDSAERVSKKIGYTTRGAKVTTRDQIVSNLPTEVQHKVFRALKSCVRQYADSVHMDHPNYTEKFPGGQTFVIRYDGGVKGRSDCKPHWDSTNDLHSASLVINLSALDDYVGGGTEFYEKNGTAAKVACPYRGHGIVFNGTKLFHGGAPVTSGVRFVLVALFKNKPNFLDAIAEYLFLSK